MFYTQFQGCMHRNYTPSGRCTALGPWAEDHVFVNELQMLPVVSHVCAGREVFIAAIADWL